MVGMTVEQIGIYTVADLERERDRDDRLRWELLEGELAMTPSPRPVHQRIVSRLLVRLAAVLDDSIELFTAPLDVRLSERTVLQPDLVMVRIWDLVDGAYVLTHHVTGHEPVHVTHPVELTFRVSELMSPTS